VVCDSDWEAEFCRVAEAHTAVRANLGRYGRWAFAEFTAVYEIEAEFRKLIDEFFVERIMA
jgi:hypothetical protein